MFRLGRDALMLEEQIEFESYIAQPGEDRGAHKVVRVRAETINLN